MESDILNQVKSLIPDLNNNLHKGSCGRVAVFGGSIEFTGAPYFAGISALKTGVDLVHVISSSSSASAIKSYSPELMVLPYLDSDTAIELIEPWLQRLHAVVIGPGLGRLDSTFNTVGKVINALKSSTTDKGKHKPIIFDADGLYFIMKHQNALKDYKGEIYCTPNVMEFTNLLKSFDYNSTDEGFESKLKFLCSKIGPSVTLVVKGKVDSVYQEGRLLEVSLAGSPRRCGGQGDLLSGALAAFAAWVTLSTPAVSRPTLLAGYGAAALTRTCSRLAFTNLSRSMTTTDMISEIRNAFKLLFE